MKAIIIQDSDARALLEQLELKKLRGGNMFVARAAQAQGIPQQTCAALLDEMHRSFHYVVTRWLQEQGANVVR